MGGYGSTRWNWHIKKDTVDDSRMLSIFYLNQQGLLKPKTTITGSLTWTNSYTGEYRASIGYEINTSVSNPYVRIYYTITRFDGSKEEFDYKIRLETTACNLGGSRWWFICPLSVDGRNCNKRVGKLYIPSRGNYFGCRHCYDLTYRSSQESDKRINALKQLG